MSELPPPAKVEVIPLKRGSDCKWRDGYWDYRGRAWRWISGAWVLPEDGCYYARPTTRFEQTSAGMTLVHRRGKWYPDDASARACADPKPCTVTAAEP